MQDNPINKVVPSQLNPIDPPTRIRANRRRRFIWLAVIILIFIGAGVSVYYIFPSTNSLPVARIVNVEPAAFTPAEVAITSSGFLPQTITIAKGQAVTWTNNDVTGHVVTSDPYPTDSALTSLNSEQEIAPGDSYSYIFSSAGTYTYHDNLHPTMTGTIIVK